MLKKVILILIAVVLLVGLAAGGYLGWRWRQKFKTLSSEKNALDDAGQAAEKIIENAAKAVLPSIGANPLENKPDINPIGKANPFKYIKINPFE